MLDTDMIIIINTGYVIKIQDSYSSKHYTPDSDTSLGGTDDLEYISGGIDENGHINIIFKRDLKTQDKYDEEIFIDKTMTICWAIRDDTQSMEMHEDGHFGNNNIGASNIVFASTQELFEYEELGLTYTTFEHVNLMSVCWGVIVIIAAISARYFKWTRWWLPTHVLLMVLVIIATCISSSRQIRYDKVFVETLEDMHLIASRLGFFILSLCTAQGVFGLALLYYRIRSNNLQAQAVMTRGHKLIGWLLVLCGIVAIYAGKQDIGREFGFYCFMVAVLVCFEIFMHIFTHINNHSFILKRLKEMNYDEAYEKIKSGEVLMFFDNLVVNARVFKQSHPGGKFMIAETVGEDLGGYLSGCSSYGGRFSPYAHTENAFSIVNYMAIAKIPYPVGYFTFTEGQNQEVMEFIVFSQQLLSSDTWLLTLKSQYFSMAPEPKLEWVGKHFKVVYNHKNYGKVRRYYSGVFVNLGLWCKEFGLSIPGENECPGSIKFIYKFYQGGIMTGYFKSLTSGQILSIQGPFGPGLMIKELKGDFIAYVGGTGLITFLDFIYYIWKNSQQITEFSFTICLCINELNDCFCLDLLQKVQDAIPQVFKLVLSVGDNKQNTVLDGIIENTDEKKYEKIWICGPSGFNRSIYDYLIDTGVNKSKIALV